jgi:ribonuclease HI
MIEIFTDGGCSGNPGPGGWAFIALDNGTEIYRDCGAEKDTTNNKMELTAALQALEWFAARSPARVRVSTDSQYVQMGISKWIFAWEKNGWKTSGKKPVKNKELWQRLKGLSAKLQPEWVWVKGHAGNPLNEACDALVQMKIRRLLKREQGP